MCGIFGYIGTKTDTAQTVLEGLKLLEYRGYDSWGIAVKHDGRFEVDKHIGKIGNAVVDLPASTLGIGHTRWATHGGVIDTNAHPHLDCTKRIAVVHNGIVENFAEIKEELIKKGHTFISETDTEVIPHLIEESLKTQDPKESVRSAFNRLHGMNAIVVSFAGKDQIIAAKNGSPLVVGLGDDGLYVSSDITGVINHTKRVVFLKDNEMVVLEKGAIFSTLKDGVSFIPAVEEISWSIEDTDTGFYPHFMLKEIHEQANVVRNIAKHYDERITEFAELIDQAYGTFFIAAGTAFHACLAGVYLFSAHAKKHVNTAVASEFNYLEDFLTDKSLIIAISQSGETIDVIEPLKKAQGKNSKIAALVNNLGSTLYRMADYKMLLGAGPEKAVASTKAYMAQISILFLVSLAMKNRLEEGKQLLLKAADEIDRLVSDDFSKDMRKIAKVLADKEHMYVLGRNVSYQSALEAALKIKEVSYIHTEGFAGGELKHGTMALITEGTPVIVFAPSDESYEAIISNAMEVKARGALVIGISSQPSEVFDHFIRLDDIGESIILSQIVPAQLLAYYLALERGLDPDKPRNLAKSVTVK